MSNGGLYVITNFFDHKHCSYKYNMTKYNNVLV